MQLHIKYCWLYVHFLKWTCRTIMARIKLFLTPVDVFLMSFLLFSCNFCTFTAGSPYMGTRKLRAWHANLERFCELKQMLVLIGSLNIIAIEIGGVFCSVWRSKTSNLAFTASLTIICSMFTIPHLGWQRETWLVGFCDLIVILVSLLCQFRPIIFNSSHGFLNTLAYMVSRLICYMYFIVKW